GSAKPTVALAGVDPLLRHARWIKPAAVAEVYYRGIGNQNLLRQPSLKTMRTDKSPSDLLDSDRAISKTKGKATKKTAKARPRGDVTQPADITISHPDRVVFAEGSITKQDVADYYVAVM